MIRICSCIFKNISAINQGSRGPNLVEIWNVPQMLKHIGIHPQALSSYFQQIRNNKYPKNTMEKTTEWKTRLIFAPIEPL